MKGDRLHGFHLLTEYNRWMNGQLYAVCTTIPDEERKRDMGAFFRSIHGTFNHLLLADRVWLGRLTGTPYRVDSLAQELYADFEILRQEREKEDRRLTAWVEQLEGRDLDRVISYTSIMNKQPRRFRIELILTHLFHHQTHHRGQVTTLISQLGHDFGETDLAFMPGVLALEGNLPQGKGSG